MTQSLQFPSAAGSDQLPSQTLIPQLSLQSMFWRPKFVKGSVWSVHLPVAFWLIEAQRPQRVVELGTQEGTSWFAFCQALERLNPYAECLGFTAGPPDAELVEHTEAQYQELARVRQASQADALEQLDEGSVDLLHVAPGVAKSIGQEWAQWQARLSARGVVLISQAGPGQPGEALYRQVREGRAYFLFEQSQGLAIVAVGSQQSDTLKRLMEFQPGQPGMRLMQQVFQRLGLACCTTPLSGRPAAQADGRGSDQAISTARRQVESARRAAELAREEAEAVRSKADRARHEAECRLEEEQATRFDETAKLTELLQAAEAAQAKSQARIEELETAKRQALEESERQAQALEALQQRHQALEQRHEQQQHRLDAAERASAALQEENTTLHRQQQARFDELAELTRMLQEKERRLAELSEQPKRLVDAFATLGKRSKARGDRRTSKEDLRLVRESGFFDEAWYAGRYPDVGQSGMNGLEHFVKFGGQEGRSPGPAFDSQWYLLEYPDVAQAGLNPLVHYLRFGSKEDRLPTPVAWQGEKHGS
ncbi:MULTISPECIES: class I SAM-dependent methyltransferase [unclassified Halomonas]|uniref:class I SAM-dependent methyltransferase n=1 Tax=unclassified Halomonas TaxID=2609666 RepID=UPI002888B8FE|nr:MULTISPECIES: class I SAM-dependent methyltransferase [unclassified Halomonas]MDT0500414.1 class I SAM-dependent methyltransferase [Halomonas sp. PAR7]MDT0511689.1 class I SAM-dependent methyltransferase [Halomonas sp. LES1]MDT0590023.1 class I SAM-dependent methyltransferase [Halomonas sp. PAR8]